MKNVLKYFCTLNFLYSFLIMSYINLLVKETQGSQFLLKYSKEKSSVFSFVDLCFPSTSLMKLHYNLGF